MTEKEKHDGQKQACSKRISRVLEATTDSPTASKDSFKMLRAVAANLRFKLASVDIRVAFLQSKVLDRDVFVEPPSDVKKQGWIWRLKNPLYGLSDA